jgi:hypothetical protein
MWRDDEVILGRAEKNTPLCFGYPGGRKDKKEFLNMKKNICERLQNPESKYRAKPFWAWNGKLEEEELHFQIDAMKKMGFGGFFMHSRTGLETEYMGEEWFRLIRSCAEYGAKTGMEAWLYDEDRWPSGTCGGLVTKKKENRMRFISEYDCDEDALSSPDVERIVKRYALLKDEEDKLIDYKEISCKEETPEGYVYVVYAEELMTCSEAYNGFAYLDTMNGEAVEEYLRSTHDKYAEICGDLLGKEIYGIFTDEPHRGALFNGFGNINKNQFRMLAFSEQAPEKFYEKYKREICIPKIYYGKSGEALNEEAAAYIDVLDDLFTKSFAEKYHNRCRRYNMTFTGHILHEDDLGAQTAMSGSMMRFYEYMDYPGIDNLSAHNHCYWAAIQCASVARQLGKPFVLSELYGCTGWDMPLREYKRIGDWQALFGINLRCPHLSWYTMEGEAKRDYPASLLHQNAWYRDWKILEDYFGRIGMILTEGERKTDLLVIHPVEQMWKYVRKGWMWSLSLLTEDAKRLNDSFLRQCRDLISLSCEFDYGDEELLFKYGCAGKDEQGAFLRVGKAVYRTVMVADWQIVRESTRSLINKFVAMGGRIVSNPKELSRGTIAETPKDVTAVMRKWEGDDWLFLLNLNETERRTGDVRLSETFENLDIEEWNMVSLECLGKSTLRALDFDAGQMRIFRLRDNVKQELIFKKEENREEKNRLFLPETMEYELGEPNVLVLDRAWGFLDGEPVLGGAESDVLKLDRALRDKFGLKYRGGEMIQPWFASKYCPGSKKSLGKLKLIYRFISEIEYETEVAAEYDKIFCNGIPAEKTGRRWIDKCFRVFSVHIVKGINEIVYETNFREESNLEAIYILGDFGVSEDYKIIPLPKKISTENIEKQGFPFYSGYIRYKTGIESGRLRIEAESLKGTSLHIVGGKEEKILAFSPFMVYTDLERELNLTIYFTRRNTFGPFHLLPQPAEAYGPFSFVSSGENWTDDYVLIPQGFICKIYKI